MTKLTVLKTAVIASGLFWANLPCARASAALELYDGASCATSDCIMISDSGTVTTHGTASVVGTPLTFDGFVDAAVKVGTVFSLNVETGESQPVLPGGSMDLDTNDVVAAGAGKLTVLWSDINFTLTPGLLQASGGPTLSQNIKSLDYLTFANGSNTLFDTSGPAYTNTAYVPPGSFSTVTSSLGVPAAPYSMTQELVITATGSGHVSGDFTLDVVPEPASIVLLGSVLLFVGKAMGRKTKRG